MIEKDVFDFGANCKKKISMVEAILDVGLSELENTGETMPEATKSAVVTLLLGFLQRKITYEEASYQMQSMIGNCSPLDKLNAIVNQPDEPIPQAASPQDSNRSKSRPWTPYEDQRLLAGIYKFGPDQWNSIANYVGNGRTRAQCSQRWQRGINPKISKSAWNPEEEAKLLSLVAKHDKSWKLISDELGNRSDVQCRYKYVQLKKHPNMSEQVENSMRGSKQWQSPMSDQMGQMAAQQSMMKQMGVNQNQLNQQMQMTQANMQQYMQNSQQKSMDQMPMQQMSNQMQQLSNMLMQQGGLNQMQGQNPFSMNPMQQMQFQMPMQQNTKMNHQTKPKKPRNTKNHNAQAGGASNSKQNAMQNHMMQQQQPQQPQQSPIQQSMQNQMNQTMSMQQLQNQIQNQIQQQLQSLNQQNSQNSYSAMNQQNMNQQMQQPPQQQFQQPQMSQQSNYNTPMQQNSPSQYQQTNQQQFQPQPTQNQYQQQMQQMQQQIQTPTMTQMSSTSPMPTQAQSAFDTAYFELELAIPTIDANWFSEY